MPSGDRDEELAHQTDDLTRCEAFEKLILDDDSTRNLWSTKFRPADPLRRAHAGFFMFAGSCGTSWRERVSVDRAGMTSGQCCSGSCLECDPIRTTVLDQSAQGLVFGRIGQSLPGLIIVEIIYVIRKIIERPVSVEPQLPM